MRFLQLNGDHEFSLVEREEEDIPRYAILSHTRETEDNEYTFRDAMEGKGKDKPGYRKVRFCVEQAARDRLDFCWIDTCCVDTSNRKELLHAMELMFSWYQNAEKCYVYLSDVSHNPADQHYPGSTKSNSDLRNSRWFSSQYRPELLASISIEFFSREGTYLGNRTSMAQTLEEMRDVLENTNSFDALIPPQWKMHQQFEWHGPFRNTYGESLQMLATPDIPPMHTYAHNDVHFSSTDIWTEDSRLTHSQKGQHGKLESYSSQHMPRETAKYRAGSDQADAREVTNMSLGSFSELCTASLNNGKKQAWMDSLRFGDIDVGKWAVKNARPQTCEWVLHTPEYAKWLDTSPENEKYWILHIKGSSGTGKSTLMKFFLSHAQEWAKGVKTVSFFFTPPTSDLESSIAGAYRSLSAQLLQENLALQDVFDGLNISKPSGEQGSQWTINALELLMKQIVRRCGPILCFIDAIDQCPMDQAKDMIKFFEDIHSVAESYGTVFQVCFSSRNYSFMAFDSVVELVLEAQPGYAQTIGNYIENGLSIGNSESAYRIKNKLQKMSSKGFVWVVLIVGFLNREFVHYATGYLWQRLLDISNDLDGLFREHLSLKSGQDVEQLFFHLVLFARRPLSPEQLYSAIRGSIRPEQLHFAIHGLIRDLEEIPMDMEQFITKVSQGLMHITNDGVRQVRFIHESVRQFFVDHPALIFIRPDRKGDLTGQGHERLKQCCLDQIGIDAFTALHIPRFGAKAGIKRTKGNLKRVNSKFPFLEYAVSNVLFHSNSAELGGVSQKRFLKTFPLTKWVRLHNFFEKSWIRRYSANVGLLYLLVEYNMPELIRTYPNSSSGLEIVRERYGCPVFAAMATGREEALKAILKGDADDYPVEFNQLDIGPDFQFSQDRDVLSYSAEFGFKGILASLLQNDATDVNTADRLGRTPLMFAARTGHEAVVKMMLETGRVNVTSKDHNGETALMLAAHRGHRSVVQMLFDTHKVNADVELLYKNGRIPSEHEPWMMPLFSKVIFERAADCVMPPTDVQAQQLTLADEMYFSMDQFVTTNSDFQGLDDASTVPSSGSELKVHISRIAEDLLASLFSERADTYDVARVHEALPEMLLTFAVELGHVSETQINRDAMVFVHENRRIIAGHFLNAWSERLYSSRNSVDDIMSSQEKISRWNRRRYGSKDIKLEGDLTFDESSLKGQTNHGKLHSAASTAIQISNKESKEDEQSDCMITRSSFSDFVTQTPVYQLLVTRLRRELFLVPSVPNHMLAIRQRILKLLPGWNSVSRKTPAQAHTIRFLMYWDPLKFFEEQLYEGKPQEMVGKVITLTGSARDAQAQTCAEYLSQTWPCTGRDIILLLKNVLGSEPGHRHECELLNGTRLTAWIKGSQFLVEAFGTGGSIAEVGEQFAWLGAALRSSPSESGVAYCTPIVRRIENSYPTSEATGYRAVYCTIQYAFVKGEEVAHTVNGQCWEHLFRNPVVVTGYPIPRRPQNSTGLEISISLMTALCQAHTVTMFDGKPFIKGFCTMLVPTRHEEHFVTWHVLTNEDGSHMSYADPRAQNITKDGSDSIGMFDVERSRHIIGWCASARSYAGAAEADYDIGWSGLETPYEGDRLLEKTITSQKLIVSSGSFTLGLKDIPSRHVGDQYVKRLRWVAGRFTVLFDVKDGRAWMFDGASSLLHLVRASLRFSQRDDFSDQFLFKPHHLEEAPPTKTGKAAAIWVLTNETNKRIKLYESAECLKERVEDILHILEQVASYQDRAESSDISTQQLEGFDFNGVAMVEERIKPRITELPARGRGWIDFTKAIHAMNLFGSGFGELIRPTENQTVCSFWDKVPKGENYLAVSVSDIMRIQQREGNNKGGLLRLVDNIYWHKPGHIFEACLCASESAERHSDRIQILTPRGNLDINDKALQNPGSLAAGGAVIFGHTSQNLERLRRSRSTSTHQSASLSCYDSGIGSSLDSLSVTPADSQFEAVSDTSATSTRKRSSSTFMAGRAQGERSSAVGGMESSEKIPALPQNDSFKRSKMDLPPKHWNHATNPTTRSHRFTIGWISPLPLEKEAARLVMDEEYPQEEYDNVYYLGGRIGNHKVIIGMPTNMGLSNAAILAAKMSAGFPDIQYFLVVGIAGGVPNYGSAGGISEIVLGDVVVSYPRRKHGGVIQYDKGAWKDSGRLDFHGHTNGVHRNLMAAINNFRSRGCFQNVTQVLQQMRLKLDERRKNQYDDPGATCDSLFADTYEHQGTRSDDCKDCCDREQVISRAKRGKAAFRLPDSPFVHFGTIASSNQLQISVAERRRMQQQHEVLCFEMEAAGVMEEYPCMVIRGICDYADSHKNKGWQNYAAATAAAYAKGLLAEIPPIYCTDSS